MDALKLEPIDAEVDLRPGLHLYVRTPYPHLYGEILSVCDVHDRVMIRKFSGAERKRILARERMAARRKADPAHCDRETYERESKARQVRDLKERKPTLSGYAIAEELGFSRSTVEYALMTK